MKTYSIASGLAARCVLALTLIVAGASLASAQDTAPAFTSTNSANFQVGIADTFVVTTTGVPTAAITVQGSLPPGVLFSDRGNGSATLSGTPAAGTGGRTSVVLTATNSVGIVQQTLFVNVTAAATVASADHATFVAGLAGSFTIYAFGEPFPTLTVSGDLPPGLGLVANDNASATLSGTPTLTGTFTLSVSASNALGTEVQTLTIEVLPRAPSLSDFNHTGMYYDLESTGYAVSIVEQGGVVLVSWYTFGQNGRPIWFIAATTRQGDGRFAGNYTLQSGIPYASINNAPAQLTSAVAGMVSLSFSPEDVLDFRFTANDSAFPEATETRTLSKLIFDPAVPVCRFTNSSRATATNYTDLWWKPSESGWGTSIVHQGNLIYLVWYTYAEEGQALWMTALLSRQADGSFSGDINRASIGGWYYYHFNGPVTTFPLPVVGTATLRFSDGEHGVFDYHIGTVNQTKNIQRIPFSTPLHVCE